MIEYAKLGAEKVRLLIWDLDDTFWTGTLTEGGIVLSDRNIAIVRTLADRGIISSICSKNDPDRVRVALEAANIWDYFVFPRIAWESKGAMVRSIVESAQLRPETIMFVDDNPINLNEVKHYNPGIQLAEPDFLEGLLDDPRFKGKDDRELTRLQQYKVLEKKEIDRTQFADASREFLRQSEVQISFHHDILAEFDRVHELINRTNQLNFTKNRVSEDRDEARAAFERELRLNPNTHTAFIKVSDKYGEYGIVGFYMIKVDMKRGQYYEHFLFSCRTLNMGIEQFVYQKLGRVRLEIVGEVVSELATKEPIDWISVVDDAEKRTSSEAVHDGFICLRGACELDQVAHYIGYRYQLIKEFPFPSKGWGVPFPAAQFASILDDLQRPEHRLLVERLPGLSKRVLDTVLLTGKADVVASSFSMEQQWSHFRYKETGLVFPIKLEHGTTASDPDLTKFSYADIKQFTKIELSEAEWRWFQQTCEYVGGFDEKRFQQNVSDMMVRLQGKRVILVMLNTRHGPPSKALETNARINAIVESTARKFEPRFVYLDDLVEGPHEVRDPHHFRREVYPRLAKALLDAAH